MRNGSEMSTAKLINKHQGAYSVVFLNNHGLERNEIVSIFSKFAQVKYVVETGSNCGYRFVRLLTLEDAEKVVEGMRDHPTIKLVPHRKDSNNNNASEKNPKSVSERLLKFSRSVSQGELTDNVSDDGESAEGSTTSDTIDDFFKFKSSSENSSNMLKRSDRKIFAKKSDLDDNATPYDSEDQDVPPLVKVSNKMVDKEKREVLNASEVVVGNIHMGYSEAYLLHLFEKFEPLAITEIQIIPKTVNRYCHVYFTNDADAAEVKRKFDKYELSGKKLVILQSKTLTEL